MSRSASSPRNRNYAFKAAVEKLPLSALKTRLGEGLFTGLERSEKRIRAAAKAKALQQLDNEPKGGTT